MLVGIQLGEIQLVGMQLVGEPRGEAAMLSGAVLCETMMGIVPDPPIEPTAMHEHHRNKRQSQTTEYRLMQVKAAWG